MKLIASAILIGGVLLAGCDLLGKSGDDLQADTYDVRILTSEGTIIHSETLVDPPLVDLPEVSSSMEAAFEANWLTYEGRDQATYDPSDLLLTFYLVSVV